MLEIFVAKNGDDFNVGTFEKPFKTIERAKMEVRKLIADGAKENIKVIVNEGEYSVKNLMFDSQDSFDDDFSVSYEAKGDVILNGGIFLSPEDFVKLNESEKARLKEDVAEKVVKIDLNKYGVTRSDYGEICVIGSYTTAPNYDDAILKPMWCELFVDDKRMTIARYPNEGFLHTKEPVRHGESLETADGKSRMTYEEWENFRNPIGDIRRIDADTAKRANGWKSIKDVWIFGYPRYGWADESNIVENIDFQNCTMQTRYVSRYGIVEQAPYYFFNVFEEIDSEGEWFLDRENGILYIYPPQNFMESSINLSVASRPLITVNNAKNITFRGFSLTATRDDAVVINGDNITVESCEVKNVSGWAIKICGENCKVKDCHIHHIGRGGILIEGGYRNTLTSSNNLVTNNHIHHIAEIYNTYHPGVKIGGVGCCVSHNCIHHSAHMAIGFSGNDHIIEYNEIYEVCLIADDSSAIYSGRDYTTCGNVIRYNYFHDICSDKKVQDIGTFAVYCDDNLGATAIYGNIMYRCQSAVLLHGGHDMIFKNNLIIDSCEKSKHSIMFHRYGYWQTLIKGGAENREGTHWVKLDQVPWQSEIWRKKYPHISEYVTWDAKNEQSYPHYCDVSNNIIINHESISINFSAFSSKYIESEYHNVITNNVEIKNREFAGIPKGDILDLSNNRFSEIIENFKEIPFSTMGLLKGE